MADESESRSAAPTVVVGLGNSLLGDEGIGVHLLRALEEKAGQYPRVEFCELGSGGLSLLHVLENREKAIMIDCAFMGAPPGELRRFTPEEIRTTKRLPRLTLHEGDVLQILQLARQLEREPAEVVIFGIEPAALCPSESLSPTLAERLPEYVREIEAELR